MSSGKQGGNLVHLVGRGLSVIVSTMRVMMTGLPAIPLTQRCDMHAFLRCSPRLPPPLARLGASQQVPERIVFRRKADGKRKVHDCLRRTQQIAGGNDGLLHARHLLRRLQHYRKTVLILSLLGFLRLSACRHGQKNATRAFCHDNFAEGDSPRPGPNCHGSG